MKVKAGTTISFDNRFKTITERGNYKRKIKRKPEPKGTWLVKVLGIATIVSGLWVACDYQNKPTLKAEAKTVEEVKSNFPKVYYSADMPKEPTIEELITKYFPENPSKALSVARCESNLNPLVVGDLKPIRGIVAKSYGIFQIRDLKGRNLTEEEKTQAEPNIKRARAIYDGAGKTFAKDWVRCSKTK